jgi:hypothetical protein
MSNSWIQERTFLSDSQKVFLASIKRYWIIGKTEHERFYILLQIDKMKASNGDNLCIRKLCPLIQCFRLRRYNKINKNGIKKKIF